MTDLPTEIWGWVVPAAVVFGSAAVIAVGGVWMLRLRRRSPAARAAAEADRVHAGSALVRLDDAVTELDLEVGLSGAMYDGTAPASLRRARMTATHVRDTAFEEYGALTADTHPEEVRRTANRIRSRSEAALATIAAARAEHAAWMQRNVTAATQVASARARLDTLRAEWGTPHALLAGLSERFDRAEWAEALRAATATDEALGRAASLISAADLQSADPTRSALPTLADAERALREAQTEARRFDDQQRSVTDAARTVSGELAQARHALRAASELRGALEPADAERLGLAIRQAEAALVAAERMATRQPTAATDAIARTRDRLDLAVGDAHTAQQRLRGARSALPGAMSLARAAIARAEPRALHAGADARVRMTDAHRELAAARDSSDPVEALDAARRAYRHAEDAVALADYDGRTRE